MGDTVKYNAEITGHHAPYKWKLKRSVRGASESFASGDGSSGESMTYEEAIEEAAHAAAAIHDDWLHKATVNIEPVFVGPAEAPTDEDLGNDSRWEESAAPIGFLDDLPVAEPKRPRGSSLPPDTGPSDFAD